MSECTVPCYRALFPVSECTIPCYRTLFPVSECTVPCHRTLIPVSECTIPCYRALFPVSENTVPCYRTLFQASESTVPCSRAPRYLSLCERRPFMWKNISSVWNQFFSSFLTVRSLIICVRDRRSPVSTKCFPVGEEAVFPRVKSLFLLARTLFLRVW